jgi:hypothetical protein
MRRALQLLRRLVWRGALSRCDKSRQLDVFSTCFAAPQTSESGRIPAESDLRLGSSEHAPCTLTTKDSSLQADALARGVAGPSGSMARYRSNAGQTEPTERAAGAMHACLKVRRCNVERGGGFGARVPKPLGQDEGFPVTAGQPGKRLAK